MGSSHSTAKIKRSSSFHTRRQPERHLSKPEALDVSTGFLSTSLSDHDLQYASAQIVDSSVESATGALFVVKQRSGLIWKLRTMFSFKSSKIAVLEYKDMEVLKFESACQQLEDDMSDGYRSDVQSPKPGQTPTMLRHADSPASSTYSSTMEASGSTKSAKRTIPDSVKKARRRKRSSRVFPSADDLDGFEQGTPAFGSSCAATPGKANTAEGTPKPCLKRVRSTSSIVSPFVRQRSELRRCDKRFTLESEVIDITHMIDQDALRQRQFTAPVVQERIIVRVSDHHHRSIVGFKEELEQNRTFKKHHPASIVSVFATAPVSPCTRG
eukprot:ANDGO_05727.mRNA.1 hypothetical protein